MNAGRHRSFDCGHSGVSLPTLAKLRAPRIEWTSTMADTRAPVQRPISPHLSIYKPMLTTMMSIVHRITGGALYFGTLLLAWWLVAAASGSTSYAKVQWFMGTWIG